MVKPSYGAFSFTKAPKLPPVSTCLDKTTPGPGAYGEVKSQVEGKSLPEKVVPIADWVLLEYSKMATRNARHTKEFKKMTRDHQKKSQAFVVEKKLRNKQVSSPLSSTSEH